MRKFNFPIGVLIAAARLGWINCRNGIADFSAFRAVYTSTYIQAKEDAITVLSLMPDEFQRSVMHETKRIDLINAGDTAIKAWRKLRRYTVSAYPPNMVDARLKDMGREFLQLSLEKNWTAMESMLTAGSTFIAANATTLMANNNMPATFQAAYDALLADFITAKNTFYGSEESSETLTAEINIAANSVYDDWLIMMQDGQAVYQNNIAVKETFVLEYLLSLVSPTGAAGLKGTITRDGEPQAGLIVELENGNKSVITDAEGAFDFGNKLASGNDTLLVKQGDEILKEEEVDIPAGTTVTEHVELPGTPTN